MFQRTENVIALLQLPSLVSDEADCVFNRAMKIYETCSARNQERKKKKEKKGKEKQCII